MEHVIGFDALYESMLKCKRGVIWKNSVAFFYLNGIEQTLLLESRLKDGTYKARKPKKFIITAPKEREIVSITYKDRVYQRSLNDNCLYPVMTASFIADNLACQKGKGTDVARERLDEFLHKFYRKHKLDGYVLQCDIKGYYPNMSHTIAKRCFKEKLPTVAYNMTETILDNQYEGTVGYNPGSQMIQILGIALLDKLDHFIKERLRIKYYLRYMDDFVLIHHDAEYLEHCKEEINEFLADFELNLSEEKTKLYPIKKGILFLGFRHKLTESGKVIRLINPNNVKRYRKKLRRLVNKAKRGEMTKAKVDFCYESWKAHARKGNSFKLLKRMDAFYAELWR